MNRLYVIARKNKDGSVDIFKPGHAPNEPMSLWVSFDKYRASRPDYRNKYIMLNCYTYNIMWDKTNQTKIG